MGHCEKKDIDIQYILSEDKPVDIMTKNNSESEFARHTRRITDGEHWEIADTGKENVNKTGVTDDVINRGKTEYSSHALAEVMDGIDRNE